MSAKFIRRIVEVFIAILFIGAFLQIGRAVAAMLEGEFGTLHWPLQAGALELTAAVGDGASAVFVDGVLELSGQPFWHGVDLMFSLAVIAIFVAVLMGLRTVLFNFAEGEVLSTANAAALRRMGLLLFAVFGLSVLHAVLLQAAIISAVQTDANTVLHPSISWNVNGMTNLWLHYDVPIFTLVFGGVAILFSEAFKAGTAYREDSESVV